MFKKARPSAKQPAIAIAACYAAIVFGRLAEDSGQQDIAAALLIVALLLLVFVVDRINQIDHEFARRSLIDIATMMMILVVSLLALLLIFGFLVAIPAVNNYLANDPVIASLVALSIVCTPVIFAAWFVIRRFRSTIK